MLDYEKSDQFWHFYINLRCQPHDLWGILDQKHDRFWSIFMPDIIFWVDALHLSPSTPTLKIPDNPVMGFGVVTRFIIRELVVLI